MKLKYEYIHFVRARKQGLKTWIYLVRANYDSALLGVIKYLGRWRQYVFYPEEGTVFEKTCLTDIKNFCIDLNERQRLRSRCKK